MIGRHLVAASHRMAHYQATTSKKEHRLQSEVSLTSTRKCAVFRESLLKPMPVPQQTPTHPLVPERLSASPTATVRPEPGPAPPVRPCAATGQTPPRRQPA